MYRFIGGSSRVAGLLRQHCDRCKQHPVAAQGARYLSEHTNNTDQSAQSADQQDAKQLSGFAKSFKEMTEIAENIDKPIKDNTPFTELLRKSTFVDMGDPRGKVVEGTIFHTVYDDLYIDFGWKLHCICLRPVKRGHLCVKGAKVRLLINELELTSRFLGETNELTLSEADCKVLSVIWSPVKQDHASTATERRNYQNRS